MDAAGLGAKRTVRGTRETLPTWVWYYQRVRVIRNGGKAFSPLIIPSGSTEKDRTLDHWGQGSESPGCLGVSASALSPGTPETIRDQDNF